MFESKKMSSFPISTTKVKNLAKIPANENKQVI